MVNDTHNYTLPVKQRLVPSVQTSLKVTTAVSSSKEIVIIIVFMLRTQRYRLLSAILLCLTAKVQISIMQEQVARMPNS